MTKTQLARRILLDQQAAEHLNNIMATLREEGSHLSLVSSKAVSWIVSEFATRYFAKDKNRMIETLFNRKAFLRSVLSNLNAGSNEEIQNLESTLRNLRHGRSVNSIIDQTEKRVEAKTAFNSNDV